MLVQDIKKTVGEPPQEEEDGDKGNGDDGLSGGDLRGAGDGLVADTLPTVLESFDGGWASLTSDFFEGGFDVLAEHGDLW